MERLEKMDRLEEEEERRLEKIKKEEEDKRLIMLEKIKN